MLLEYSAMLGPVYISVSYDKPLNNLSPRNIKSRSKLKQKSSILQETDEQLFGDKFGDD